MVKGFDKLFYEPKPGQSPMQKDEFGRKGFDRLLPPPQEKIQEHWQGKIMSANPTLQRTQSALTQPQPMPTITPNQPIQPVKSTFTPYEQQLLTPDTAQMPLPKKTVVPQQPIQPSQFSSEYERQLLAPNSTPQAEYPKQPGPLAILGNAWQQTQDQSKGIRQGQAQTAMAERVPIQGTALEKFGLSVNAVQDARTGATILELSGEPDKKIRRFVPGRWDADRKVWVVRNFWDHQNNKEVPFGTEEGTMTPQDFAEVIAGRMEGNQAKSGFAQKAGYLEDRFSSQILPALSLQPEKSDYHGTAETFGEKAIDVAAGIAGRSFTPLPGMGGTTFFGAMSGTVGKEAAMKATPYVMNKLPELSSIVAERLATSAVAGGVSSSATLAANRAFLEFINTPLSRNEWKDIPAHMKGAAKGIVQDAAVGFIIGAVFGVTVQGIKEARLARELKSFTHIGADQNLKTEIYYKLEQVKNIKDLEVGKQVMMPDGRSGTIKSINPDGSVTVWGAKSFGAEEVIKPTALRQPLSYAEPVTRANAKARVALMAMHGGDYTEAVQNQLIPYGQAGENVLRVAAGEKPLPYSTVDAGRLDTTAAKVKPHLDNVQARIDQGIEAPKPGEMKGLGFGVPAANVQQVAPFKAAGMTVKGAMPSYDAIGGNVVDTRVLHPSEFKPDPDAAAQHGNSWPELLRLWKSKGSNVDPQMKDWLVSHSAVMEGRGIAKDVLKGMDVKKMSLEQVMDVLSKSPQHKHLVDALEVKTGGTPSANLPVSTTPAPAPALEPTKPISIPAPPPLENVTAPSSALPSLKPSGISTPQPATPVPAVPVPQTATPKPETTPLEKGSRVTWVNSKGETMSGTIAYDSEVGKTKGYAVQVDQTTTAGGVPIKRKEFIAASDLRPLDAGTGKPVEATPTPDTTEKQPSHPATEVADLVKSKLAVGQSFTSAELFNAAQKAYGGTMASGTISVKDAYDAMELGVNRYLMESEHKVSVGPEVSGDTAETNLRQLEEMLEKLPTQTKRNEEQDKFQQFSTPPTLAYVAAWIASPTSEDVVLEPSAGIGGLAIFAKSAGAEVVVNELSERRLELLKQLDFDHVFNEDAEQLDNILPDEIKPTLVIMNPPFSSAGDRGMTGAEVGYRHVKQALNRLEPGGRLVAIVGRGMADELPGAQKFWKEIKQKYNVRANVGIDGSNYKKYGTTFDVQILVIDKTSPTTSDPVITGKYKNLADVIKPLEVLRSEPRRTEGRPTKQAASQQAGQRDPGQSQETDGQRTPVSAPADGVGSQQPGDSGQRPGDTAGASGVPQTGGSQEGAGPVSEGRPGDRGQVGRPGATETAEGRPGVRGSVPGPATTRPDSVRTGSGSGLDTNQETAAWLGGAAQEARARLAARKAAASAKAKNDRDLGFSEPSAKSLPMNDLVDYSIIGADKLANDPNMSYEKWAAEMIEEFGASLRLFLRGIHGQSQAMLEMSPADINEMLGITEEPEVATPQEKKPTKKAAAKKPASAPEEKPETEAVPEKAEQIKSTKAKTEREGGELSDAVFSAYKPSINIKGAMAHPAQLAQSAAMAAVEMPELIYTLSLPKKVIKDGLLSDVQLEAVAYAGQAFETILPSGVRQGFLIGDGTGVGKGREIAGIILDSFHKGQKKAVWVSKNADLHRSAVRDWEDIGGDGKKLFQLKNMGGQKNGIAFLPYTTLSQGLSINKGGDLVEPEGKKSRMKQLVEWLGKDFDGVIAFDESHEMRNSVGVKPSAKALAGVELQKQFPNARIVYVSATAATEVENLAYADRLGLWGTGTAFANKNDFIGKIATGGLAAMELVARDMKAMGTYISRTISFDGVEYDRIEHKLTPEQTEVYDTLSEAWQIVLQNLDAALDETGQASDGRAKGRALGRFWSANQAFYNQVLISMQMPSVIAQVKKDIEAGHAIVMQLVNTNAAIMERKIGGLEEDQTLDDLDMTPRDMLMEFLNRSFPTQQYEEYTDDDGTVRSRPVYSKDGKPVINREALRMKEVLLDRVGSVKVPDGPLEMVLNAFGTEKVAEITGRKRRVIKAFDEESGRETRKLDTRSEKGIQADADAFMDDRKQILIFSDKGGTGQSYHADKTKKNQRKRIHYLIQPGWRADAAVQGFGRTHRSNQAHAPLYVLVTTNLDGQKRFISSIARRLDQLGALTKGQRQTGSQGLFSEKDNLEGPMARDAMREFYKGLLAGEMEGLEWKEVLSQMGMLDKIADEYGNILDNDESTKVTRFLNRILSLSTSMQNRVFQEFSNRLETMVEAAIARGTLDTGLENYRADSVEIQQEKVVYTDERSGAETKYYALEIGTRNEPVSFDEAAGEERIPLEGFYQNTKSKRIYAAYKVGTETDDYGRISDRYRLQGRSKSSIQTITKRDIDEGNWEKVGKEEAVAIWEEDLSKMPEMNNTQMHLISGTVLPIWDRLPTGQMRVIRVKTNDNQVLLGRMISERNIDAVLRKLGAEREKSDLTPQQVVTMILDSNYTAHLANGWRIGRRRLGGEYRIEVMGNDLYSFSQQLIQEGTFTERIQWETRYFIPTGSEAAKVMANVTKYRPVVDMEAPAKKDNDLGFSADLVKKVDKALKNRITEKRNLTFSERHAPEKTSIKQVAAGLRRGVTHKILQPGTVNLDLGGGRYDEGVKFLADHEIENLVYDPYARTAEHNGAILERLAQEGGADSVTLNNVLNVIPTDDERSSVLDFLYRVVKPGGKALITVYEGNGTGEGKKLTHSDGTSSWQENRKLATYEKGIKEALPANATVERKAGMYVVTKPSTGKAVAPKGQSEAAAGKELSLKDSGAKRLEQTKKTDKPFKTEAKVQFGSKEVIKRRQMLRELFDILDTPFRTGKIRKANTLGTFDTRDEVVRTKGKVAEDPRVLFHEAGHWMDKFFDWELSKTNIYDDELFAAPYVAQLMAANPTADPAMLRKEGAAEFFWMFLSEPETVKTTFPRFREAFLEKLRAHPDIFAGLLNFQELYQAYDAQDDVAKVLSVQDEPRKQKLTFSKAEMKVTAAILDDLKPIDVYAKLLTGDVDLKASKDPYILARLAKGSAGRSFILIHHGQYEWQGKEFVKVGPSLKEIADEAGEDFAEFTAYLIAKRAQELEAFDLPALQEEAQEKGIDRLEDMQKAMEQMEKLNITNNDRYRKMAEQVAELLPLKRRIDVLEKLKKRNITSGIDMDAAENVVKMYDKNQKFQRLQKDWMSWWDFLVDDGIRAGTIEKSQAAFMREMHKYYVPFKRVRDDDEQIFSGGGGKKLGDLPSAVKTIYGSGRSILNPWAQAAKDAYFQMSVNDRMKAAQALVALAEENEGMGKLMEKVPAPMRVTSFSLWEIMSDLEGAGVDTDTIDLKRGAQVFDASRWGNPKENTIAVMINGKAEFWRLDRDLYKAVMALDEESVDMLAKIMRPFAKLLRTGAVLNPRFISFNPWRDQFWTGTFAKEYKPFYDLGKGIASIAKKDDWYIQFMHSGGALSALSNFDDYRQPSIKKFMDKTMKEQIKVFNPLVYLSSASETMEQATKISVFRQKMQAGADPIEAAIAAREATVDYAVKGYGTKFVRSVVPFFNAALQSQYRMIKGFKKDPAGTTIRALLYITLPTILLYLLNRKNEWYHELPTWRKDGFWNFPNPFGERDAEGNMKQFVSLPIPFTLGYLFKTFPERVMDAIERDDPHAWDDFGGNLAKMMTPNYIPVMILPLIENWANLSTYTGRQIVPTRDLYLEPYMQHGPYTSEVSKILGRTWNLSPRRIDNFIFSYTAGLGRLGVRTIDGALELAGLADKTPKADGGIRDIPIIGEFIAESGAGGVTMERFYKDRGEAETIYKTYLRLEQEGKPIPELKPREFELLSVLKEIRAIESELRKLRTISREVHVDMNMTPAEKRMVLDQIDLAMLNLVRQAYGKAPISE